MYFKLMVFIFIVPELCICHLHKINKRTLVHVPPKADLTYKDGNADMNNKEYGKNVFSPTSNLNSSHLMNLSEFKVTNNLEDDKSEYVELECFVKEEQIKCRIPVSSLSKIIADVINERSKDDEKILSRTFEDTGSGAEMDIDGEY